MRDSLSFTMNVHALFLFVLFARLVNAMDVGESSFVKDTVIKAVILASALVALQLITFMQEERQRAVLPHMLTHTHPYTQRLGQLLPT